MTDPAPEVVPDARDLPEPDRDEGSSAEAPEPNEEPDPWEDE